jgi:hypothetical protein
MGQAYSSMSASDFAPTITQTQAAQQAEHSLADLLARWNALRTTDIPALNLKLKAAGISPVQVASPN